MKFYPARVHSREPESGPIHVHEEKTVINRWLRISVVALCMLAVGQSVPLSAESFSSCAGAGIGSGTAAACCSVFAACHDPVVIGNPVYTLNVSGCDYVGGPCGYTATVAVEFPGNSINNSCPSFFPSENATIPGDECPTSCVGAGNYDFVTEVVTGSFQCGVSSPVPLNLFMCNAPGIPSCSSCLHTTTVYLDPAKHFFCPPTPPTWGCGEGDSAAAGACCLGPGGGAPPTGGGPPIALTEEEAVATIPTYTQPGHSYAPEMGAPPEMKLRYLYGGSGGLGLPENAAWGNRLGRFWSHDFAQRIVPSPDETTVWLITKSASFRKFSDLDGSNVYQTRIPADDYRVLEWLGAGVGWSLREGDGTTTYFKSDGLWDRTENRNQQPIQGIYDAGLNRLTEVDFPSGLKILFFYDVAGRIQTLREVGVGAGGTPTRDWTYVWDSAAGNALLRINRPDSTSWRFTYDHVFPAHMATASIFSSAGSSSRVEGAWEYNPQNRLYRAWKGSSAFGSGIQRLTWTYTSATETQVADDYGNVTRYLFNRDSASGKPRVTQTINAAGCPTCGLGPNSSIQYDNPSNPGHPLLPWKITDAGGTVTELSYTDHGQVASRTEALGDGLLERTTEYAYDVNYPAFPTLIERPSSVPGCTTNRQIVRSYSALNGNLDFETRAGCQIVAGVAQLISGDTTDYDYVGTAAGSPTSVDPPGFTTTDVAQFDFDGARGDQVLLSRTDPLIGQTFFGNDDLNRRVTVTDVNGTMVTTAYDSMNRVTSVTREGLTNSDDETTSYFYTILGDLFCVKLPRVNGIEYTYDTAGRRTAVTRGTAVASPSSTSCLQTTGVRRERTAYGYNTSGQVTSEEQQFCSSGTCSGGFTTEARKEYVRTSRCHLDQLKQAKAPSPLTYATTEYGYDCNGNLEKTWDANHPSAGSAPATAFYKYDALNRMIEMRQPWGPTAAACDPNVANDPDCSITSYDYDIQDHLTSVVDAEGTLTSYVYDDRDLLTSQQSEVSGLTLSEYNLHHQLIKETDARAIVTNRTVDAADRIDFVDFVDNARDVDYVYGSTIDTADFTKGRLKQIIRNPTGGTPIVLDFKYERFGRVKQDGELARTFDKNGNTWTITYPQGLIATYSYDFADRDQTLSVNPGTGAQNIITASGYKANGPISSMTFGTSPVRTETRTYDARYLPSTVDVNGSLFHWDFTKDDVGNVSTITQTIPAGAPVRSFAYQDYQYFLTSASGPWGNNRIYQYDGVGNRTREGVGFLYRNFAYQQNAAATGSTARLTSVCEEAGPGCPVLRTYSTDAAGYLDSMQAGANVVDFTFDASGALSEVERPGAKNSRLVSSYDGRGFLRNAAQPNGGYVNASYSSQGLLYSLERMPIAGGTLERNNVLYFAGRPVAIWKKVGSGTPATTYLTTDHLGAPVFAFNQAGAAYWSGGLEPFGRDWQEGTANDMLTKGIFLRLPGQWDDALFSNATLGADIYYNVHRWYEPQTGRYTSVDPLMSGEMLVSRPRATPLFVSAFQGAYASGSRRGSASREFVYGLSNPVAFKDVLGLAPCPAGANLSCKEPGSGCCVQACMADARAAMCEALQIAGGKDVGDAFDLGAGAGLAVTPASLLLGQPEVPFVVGCAVALAAYGIDEVLQVDENIIYGAAKGFFFHCYNSCMPVCPAGGCSPDALFGVVATQAGSY